MIVAVPPVDLYQCPPGEMSPRPWSKTSRDLDVRPGKVAGGCVPCVQNARHKTPLTARVNQMSTSPGL